MDTSAHDDRLELLERTVTLVDARKTEHTAPLETATREQLQAGGKAGLATMLRPFGLTPEDVDSLAAYRVDSAIENVRRTPLATTISWREMALAGFADGMMIGLEYARALHNAETRPGDA